MLCISQISSDFEKPGLFGELLCWTIKIYLLKVDLISSSGFFSWFIQINDKNKNFWKKFNLHLFLTETAAQWRVEILSCKVFLSPSMSTVYGKCLVLSWFQAIEREFIQISDYPKWIQPLKCVLSALFGNIFSWK